MSMPGPAESVHTPLALETIAAMAVLTWRINPQTPELEPHLRQKHFLRKHGPEASYGQNRAV